MRGNRFYGNSLNQFSRCESALVVTCWLLDYVPLVQGILMFQLPFESEVYFIQHTLMLVVPYYLMRVGGKSSSPHGGGKTIASFRTQLSTITLCNYTTQPLNLAPKLAMEYACLMSRHVIVTICQITYPMTQIIF